ncbi:hypothetical protein SH668x_003015 [Planctomicrobium sp. SH668]|uniref:hypothetical protein n=1 Tax=Planctomicrobium sp. SH668 TaxID=3448126 RepID=UPI003F5BA970
MRKFIFTAFGMAILSLAVGCGGDGKVKVYKADGTLTMGGTPFGPTTLQLIALEQGKRSAMGNVDESGKVTFTTYAPGDGLPSGQYRVAVGVDLGKPPRPFPRIYRDISKSPLKINVDALDGNQVSMALDPKAGPLTTTSKMEETMNAAKAGDAIKAGRSDEE